MKIFIGKVRKIYFYLLKKGAFHILMGGFLNKFVSLFGSIIIVRLLTKQEYGILSYIENLYSYAFVIAGMGLSNSILRYVVLSKEIDEKKSYFHYALKNGFIFNIGLVLIASIISLLYPHGESFEIAKFLLIIMLLELPFQDIVNDELFFERAMFSNERYSYFSIITTILLLIGRIIGAILFGIKGIVILQVILYILISFILFKSINKKYFKQTNNNVSISTEKAKEINIYSLQYMITNGFWTIFMLNDVFLIGLFCQDPIVLAEYKVAYVLPGCMSILSGAIGTFVSPYFVQNENNLSWIKANFWRVFVATIFIIGFVSLGIAVLAKYIIMIIYGKEYLNVIPLMYLLLISSFINCGLRFTTANLLAAMGQIKYNMFVSLIGIIFQIVLNIVFIPKFQAYGAAFTSIIVYFIMSLILFIIFSKKYSLFKKD